MALLQMVFKRKKKEPTLPPVGNHLSQVFIAPTGSFTGHIYIMLEGIERDILPLTDYNSLILFEQNGETLRCLTPCGDLFPAVTQLGRDVAILPPRDLIWYLIQRRLRRKDLPYGPSLVNMLKKTRYLTLSDHLDTVLQYFRFTSFASVEPLESSSS